MPDLKSEGSVVIETLKIKIGERTVELTPSEARHLFGALGEIFNSPPNAPIVITPWYPVPQPSDWPNPHYPSYTWKTEITCDANSDEWPNRWSMDGKSLVVYT